MKRKTVGLWIYQNSGGDIIEQKLVQALKERNFDVITNVNLRDAHVVDGRIYCHDYELNKLSSFFSYNCSGQTNYQLYMYQLLNSMMPTINNYNSFALTEDKFLTNRLLRAHGIKTADFCFCPIHDLATIRQFFMKHQKIVCKPVDGYGGHGLLLFDNLNELLSFPGFTSKTGFHYFYAENFINFDGTDFRIDLVDGEFISCYGRQSKDGEWRTNVAAGGSVILREGNEKVIALAKKAAKITGLEVAGIDIIYDVENDEYVVLEVNGLPAFATPSQEAIGLSFNDKKINLIANLIERTKAKDEQLSQAA